MKWVLVYIIVFDDIRKCVYCEDDNCELVREHVIPVVYLGNRSFEEDNQWIVPSCNKCNKFAGSALFFSIPEKAKFISKRYKIKYKKILKMPYWEENEIKELNYKLRESIRQSMILQIIIKRKIKQLENVSEYPIDYLRPKFIENKMKEWIKLVKSLNDKRKKYKKDALM